MRLSLESASLRSWTSSESIGKIPANTIGVTVRYPGSGRGAGLAASVTVSPTLLSRTSFTDATT